MIPQYVSKQMIPQYVSIYKINLDKEEIRPFTSDSVAKSLLVGPFEFEASPFG